MEFRDVRFYDDNVTLDEGTFSGCTFTKCRIHYGGGEGKIVACLFDDCHFLFNGPAANTLEFMRLIFNSPGGDKLHELTFPQ